SETFNKGMKQKILGFKTINDMEATLGEFSSQWAKQKAINYNQDSTIKNGLLMGFSEAISQWKDPEKLMIGATILIGGFSMRTTSGSLRSPKGLQIKNPSALNRTKPGFSDKVMGSNLRYGRGSLNDYSTQKPALRPVNSQKFSKTGQWATGIGLSGLSSYYYYKKTMDKNK